MKTKKINFLLVLLVLLFPFVILNAQNFSGTLVFTRVHLEKENPIYNWIEVYNQTSKQKTLGKLFVSNIKTLNVLPPDIRKAGGIKLSPKQFVILCANRKEFEKKWENNNKKIIEVKALNMLSEGGYISVSTSEGELNDFDLFRYGKPSFSSNHEDLLQYQVIPFSDGTKIYKRKINNNAFDKYGGWQ